MARPPRFEYPGAVYHVMARGDGGKRIFVGKEDYESFLYWLERVCQSHGWWVHAWVLMGNHFHLLLETPEPNLSAGMRVLLGTYCPAWNRRYQRRGYATVSNMTGVSPWILRLMAAGSPLILPSMARLPRFEYPGAVYHVMARGDGGKRIFVGKEDYESFLYWLERVCQSHGWWVHAWVLMGNHFHLLLETPEPNLSAGMRVLLGTYCPAWNRRYQRRGYDKGTGL